MVEVSYQNKMLTFVIQYFVLLYLPQTLMSYPVYGTKRYGRSNPVLHPAYIPISVNVPVHRYYTDYQVPDYEDSQQDELDFTPYPAFVPYYGYAPIHTYYDSEHRRPEYGYYEEDINDPIDDIQEEMLQDEKSKENTPGYPYGQETWFEGSRTRSENNAEANAAFLQNLIIAQMYQDAAANAAVNANTASRYSNYPLVYSPIEDDRWLATEKPKEDEDVKELESLRKNKNKDNKGGKKKNKSKGKGRKTMTPPPEIPPTNDFESRLSDVGRDPESWYNEPKDYVFGNVKTYKRTSPTFDDEFLTELQQELNNRRGSRKDYLPVGEGLSLDSNQFNDNYGLWNVDKLYETEPRLVTSKPINKIDSKLSDRKNKMQVVLKSTEAPSTTTTSSSSTNIDSRRGMREEVLPRPANPVRRQLSLSSRSTHQTSVYDTIKHLMKMEENLKQVASKSPQKRFVSNESQLVAELSGLKKKAV